MSLEDRIGQVVEPPAFSNGTAYYDWENAWCGRCWHDRAAQRHGRFEDGCELIALGMAHERVEQWVYDRVRYGDREWVDVTCTKFTPDDDGPDEGPPSPKPTPPGQGQMFDAGDFDWDKPSRIPVDNSTA